MQLHRLYRAGAGADIAFADARRGLRTGALGGYGGGMRPGRLGPARGVRGPYGDRFTFPAGSVEGLAGTLCRLRDDVGLVKQSSSLARKRASDFSWEQTVSEYERLFTEMVASREPRHWLAGRRRSGTPALQAFVMARGPGARRRSDRCSRIYG